MSLSDIADPAFIRRAAAEFDRLGRLSFLTKYGYKAARKYFLVIDGVEYDSKAIVGVAHKFAKPKQGPLRPSDFSGGMPTVVALLRELGFTVIARPVDGLDEVPVAEAIALVLVQNEVTVQKEYEEWEDMTGAQYHFPNQYKNLVVTGRPIVYYRGVRRRDNRRGTAEYFGVGRVGRKWPSPENDARQLKRDWEWYCEIVDYIPFSSPVPATSADGPRYEVITNPRDWGVGVRALPLEAFDGIVTEAKLRLSTFQNKDGVSDGIVDELLLPPIDSVDVSAGLSTRSLLRAPKNPSCARTESSGANGPRRSRHAKLVGDRAEELALRWLRTHLSPSEAKTVRWVADEGERPGWDIEYIAEDGLKVSVEVKGCTTGTVSSVELTANEWRAAASKRSRYHLLIVASCLGAKPIFERIVDPFGLAEGGAIIATPSSWQLLRNLSDSSFASKQGGEV